MKLLRFILILLGVMLLWSCRNKSDTQYPDKEKLHTLQLYPDSTYVIIDSLQTKAALGNTDAMNQLARILFLGDIVEQDISSALYWTLKAASLNSFDACFDIGNAYLYGWDGFSPNEDKKPLRNYTTAEKLFLMAAEAGDVASQEKLGFLYFIWDTGSDEIDSKKSTDKHFPKSQYWYELAAKNGSAMGKFYTGIFYYNGLGVDRDAIKSLTYMKEAADMGFEPAKVLYPVLRKEYIRSHSHILY